MKIKIADLMSKRVLTALPHHSVAHVRGIMARNRIHALPVVSSEMEAVGIVTSFDLARRLKEETPVIRIMSRDVKTIAAYKDVSAAARAMRRSRIHHLVVTHEKRVVGVISSFDLMKLVEGHRFVMKKAQTKTAKRSQN